MINTCEFCLLARLDPTLRERLSLCRVVKGDNFLIVERIKDCQTPEHFDVMNDIRKNINIFNEEQKT